MHLADYGAPSCNYMYTCKILIGVDPVVYFSICIEGMNSFAYSMGSQRTSTTGWWYTYPSEKYDFVSWDDDIPNCFWKVIKIMFQTTNQTRSEWTSGQKTCDPTVGKSWVPARKSKLAMKLACSHLYFLCSYTLWLCPNSYSKWP